MVLSSLLSSQTIKALRLKQILLFAIGYTLSQLKNFNTSLNQIQQESSQSSQSNQNQNHRANSKIPSNKKSKDQGNKDETLSLEFFINRILFMIQQQQIKSNAQIKKQHIKQFFNAILHQKNAKNLQKIKIYQFKKSNHESSQQKIENQNILFLFKIIERLILKVIQNILAFEKNCNKYQKAQRNQAIFKIISQEIQEIYIQTLQTQNKYRKIGQNQSQKVQQCQLQQFFHQDSQHSFDQNKANINQSEKQQNLCQICYVPLLQKHTIFKLSQCHHQYHNECLFEVIAQYLKNNSDIFITNQHQNQLNRPKTQLNQKIVFEKLVVQNNKIFPQNNDDSYQNYRVRITSIKCPDYQQCRKYLNLNQIHSILLFKQKKEQQQEKINSASDKGNYTKKNSSNSLNTQNKNKMLERFYQTIFNTYARNNQITSFNNLKNSPINSLISNKIIDQTSQNQNNSSIYFYCHTPGCNAIYELQRQSSNINNLQNFICKSCKQKFCLKCFSSIHPSMSCKQYAISTNYLKEDEEFQKYLKTLKKPYKKCPKCNFYVDNWRGCSTVKCRCGIQFCYKCGNIGCPHAKCLKQMQKQGKEIQKK